MLCCLHMPACEICKAKILKESSNWSCLLLKNINPWKRSGSKGMLPGNFKAANTFWAQELLIWCTDVWSPWSRSQWALENRVGRHLGWPSKPREEWALPRLLLRGARLQSSQGQGIHSLPQRPAPGHVSALSEVVMSFIFHFNLSNFSPKSWTAWTIWHLHTVWEKVTEAEALWSWGHEIMDLADEHLDFHHGCL